MEGYHLLIRHAIHSGKLSKATHWRLPTKAPGSSRIAWGTDRGFVYVMEMQGHAIGFVSAQHRWDRQWAHCFGIRRPFLFRF